VEIIAESRYRRVIPRHGRMRVPGVVFATRALIPDPAADRALEQVESGRKSRRRCPIGRCAGCELL
jgi:hypothetical protein